MRKNKLHQLNEKLILVTLINNKNPILLSDLARQLNCNSNHLEQYLNLMVQKGLLITSRYEAKESEKYSIKRGKTTYYASSAAKEYLIEKKRNFLTFACTVIAAIMATLTLIATIIIPFIS